jgi:SAM-dependent methyltransferase
MGKAARKLQRVQLVAPLRIDLGCGPNKAEGWTGADSRPFKGVDEVLDLGTKRWPWGDASVDEARASHFVEHLEPDERIHFVNELFRVLKPGAAAQIIVPHWASCRAYGDLTHKWPPVSEFWFYYLSKAWREMNAPHNDGYTCDFDFTAGYSMRQDLIVRPQEYQQFALSNYKEAAQDIVATLTKRA